MVFDLSSPLAHYTSPTKLEEVPLTKSARRQGPPMRYGGDTDASDAGRAGTAARGAPDTCSALYFAVSAPATVKAASMDCA